MVEWGFIRMQIQLNEQKYAIFAFLTTSNTWLEYSTSEYPKDIDVGFRFCQGLLHVSISFWYSAVLCTSQVLEVVKNTENGIFYITMAIINIVETCDKMSGCRGKYKQSKNVLKRAPPDCTILFFQGSIPPDPHTTTS